MGQAAIADFDQADGSTAGQRLYLQKGLRGIRGEVADGLPAVANISLPALEEGLARGYSQNRAAASALIQLIAQVEDSNLYHRGGEEGAAFAKEAAKALEELTAQCKDLPQRQAALYHRDPHQPPDRLSQPE